MRNPAPAHPQFWLHTYLDGELVSTVGIAHREPRDNNPSSVNAMILVHNKLLAEHADMEPGKSRKLSDSITLRRVSEPVIPENKRWAFA